MAEQIPTPDRQERWERAAEWPLVGVAVVFVVAYAWPVIDPGLAAPWPEVLQVLTWVTWAVFVVDYVIRLALARSRTAFVRGHLVDLALVVLPLFRPLRLLRLVTLLTVLNRHAGRTLRGRVAVYVTGATVLIMFLASVAVLDAEREAPDTNIETFGGAVWWAFATVTTVGYGDRFPVTVTGRCVAAGLMLAGIALLGIVTASLASWLIERVQQVDEEAQAVTRRDVHALAAEVVALRAELAARDLAAREALLQDRGTGPPGTRPDGGPA